MIENTTVFAATGAILAAMAIGFLLWTRRLSDACRYYGYAVVVACGAMSGAYLLMAAELLTVTTSGRTESVARFIGYSIAWAAVCYVLEVTTDADRRYTLALLGTILTCLWATMASWVLSGIAGTVVSVAIFAALLGMIYVLVGPLAREATAVSGERTLLYGKLKNLSLLVFIGLIITGMLSEQNLNFTDAFVGQTIATYLDLVWLAGFGAILLRSEAALEDAAVSTIDRSHATTESVDGSGAGVSGVTTAD
ncbi:bacteriorhodopsin [Natronorubrum sp. JWXQ-INN-674]|uniref:Bacteriorhodopsin n=1 Tax=Natronorubrum halalkaliphilum TaxID=2691917 RepID=A0A6B0VJS4_9EURY|nr:bacteriorhodopsin [Natronorubrum halalkaliphilum]MXV61790.1 bacteriorhodopsin [Natronorubrum halalkaliphilum]